MFLNNVLPHPSLREFIQLYRIMHFKFRSAENIPFKAYRPRIEHCLQFFPKDSEKVSYTNNNSDIFYQQSVSLVGQHTVANYRHVGKDFFNFQVSFKPGALYRLTGIPMPELTNQYLNAVDVLGPEVMLINEQLSEVSRYTSAIPILENFLQKLVAKARYQRHTIDTLADIMLNETVNISVDQFVKKSGYSHRQFDRTFSNRMGIAPKEFLNIRRFDQAFLLKNRFPDRDWLSIAIATGFHDYQHLSKTYKYYTGMSPTKFFQLENNAPERYFGSFEV